MRRRVRANAQARFGKLGLGARLAHVVDDRVDRDPADETTHTVDDRSRHQIVALERV